MLLMVNNYIFAELNHSMLLQKEERGKNYNTKQFGSILRVFHNSSYVIMKPVFSKKSEITLTGNIQAGAEECEL